MALWYSYSNQWFEIIKLLVAIFLSDFLFKFKFHSLFVHLVDSQTLSQTETRQLIIVDSQQSVSYVYSVNGCELKSPSESRLSAVICSTQFVNKPETVKKSKSSFWTYKNLVWNWFGLRFIRHLEWLSFWIIVEISGKFSFSMSCPTTNSKTANQKLHVFLSN